MNVLGNDGLHGPGIKIKVTKVYLGGKPPRHVNDICILKHYMKLLTIALLSSDG